MTLTVTVWFDKSFGHWRARFRGPGDSYDKKVRVPADEFARRGLVASSQSKPAETIARDWATDEKRRLEGRPAARATTAIPLDDIFALYRRRNPNGSMPITLTKNEELFNNIVTYKPLAALTPGDIDSGIALDYYDFRRAEGASPRSIMNELRFLIQLLKRAEEWSRETGVTAARLTRVPKRVIEEVKLQDHRGRALTIDEIARVLEQRTVRKSITIRFRRIFLFAIATGLRRENLLALRWSWIDLERRWLTIPPSAMKGRASQKRSLSVPLSRWAIEALGPRETASDFVFANRFGGKTWRLTGTLRSMAGRAGVDRFSIKDLRNTFSKLLKQAGVKDNRIIGALMNHSSRENRLGHQLIDTGNVTEAKYLFVTPDEKVEAIEKLDELLDRELAPLLGRENIGKVIQFRAL